MDVGNWMSRTPVTFEQYDHYCLETGQAQPPDQNWGKLYRPVINVSWNEERAYCNWLSRKTGAHYNLPTEAQWEYACRAGSTTKFSFGDSENRLEDFGWYKSNSGRMTHPVGKKKLSEWGLYDMHGNVSEWCLDWYDAIYLL